MIPLTTRPGTKIVSLVDFQPEIDDVRIRWDSTPLVKGQVYTLAHWFNEAKCDCHGVPMIEVAEIDARIYLGNIIVGMSTWCPSMFELLVETKLPDNVARLTDPDAPITETFEEPKRKVPEKTDA